MPRKLTVVLDYGNAKETYSRIGLLECQQNLQSYWTTGMPRELTVVLDYGNVKETYSRIELLGCNGNLQSYWTTGVQWELTVVLDYWGAMGTYSRIGLPQLISFRVQVYIFPTRLECIFTSSPLVSSVVLHLPHSF
jgi:hypothetical protein